jgi:hypothetical protein
VGRRGVSHRRQAIGVSVLSVLLCLGVVAQWYQALEERSWQGVQDALLGRDTIAYDAAWDGSTTIVHGRPSPSAEEESAPIGTPVLRPAGGAAHAFQHVQTLSDGSTAPVAWSPCRPVHYVVDVTGAPLDFVASVDRVAAEIAAATGLVLVSDGTTSEPATLNRAVYQPDRYGDRWAPLLIRFSADEHVAELAGSVAGLAGPRWLDRGDGLAVAVSGIVLLDTEVLAHETGDGEPVYVPVLRHELAHAMGLDHVEDESQLMNPRLVEGVATFQDGDLDGLAALGRGICAPEL